MVTGYLHPGYAESLAEFGTPRVLPRCQGWILERHIPGVSDRDAMGCYPLFACQDWSLLHLDLEAIGSDLVSLALVTDPFGEYDEAYLHRCFGDVVIPFKAHFVVDLSGPIDEIGGRRRRKHARRALRKVQVEVSEAPTQFVEEWVALYDALIERHDIRGLRAFSRTAFTTQLGIPGMAMFRAVYQGAAVGAQLNFVQGDVVYAHLAAFSSVGYEVGASYALDWATIEYYVDKVRWLDLGGGTGIAKDATDGLSQYKRGWCTGTRTAYFCGRILDPRTYARMVQTNGVPSTGYFPAYRWSEFA